MTPNFQYIQPEVDVSRLAYDLALRYAQAKFEQTLRDDPDFFDGRPAPCEVEEAQFMLNKFMMAYEYCTGMEPGDLERHFDSFR